MGLLVLKQSASYSCFIKKIRREVFQNPGRQTSPVRRQEHSMSKFSNEAKVSTRFKMLSTQFNVDPDW